MATNAQLLAQQRRLIAEATADYFDDTINQYHLNNAYAIGQDRITEVRENEFNWFATANIVANQQAYQRSTNENIIRYEILRPGTTDRWDELVYLPDTQALRINGDAVSQTDGQDRVIRNGYTVLGDQMYLWPTPTTSVSNGLRVIYREVLELSAVGDVPRMPKALHHLLPYGGAIFALEESKDAAEEIVDRYRARWASVFGPHSASTKESRLALKRYYPRTQNAEIVGQNLGWIA